MHTLISAPNMDNPDDFYALLLDAHAGKSQTESSSLNAKLILLLANHIGDIAVFKEALKHAGSTPATQSAD